MDKTLVDMLKTAGLDPDKGIPVTPIDPMTGEVEIKTPQGPIRYTLKPLRESYGPGYGGPSVTPTDPRYEPLFLAIEEEISQYDRLTPGLKDSQVLLTLERMSMDPAVEPGQDELCRYLQFKLRNLLSGLEYSRQEVKTAIRTVARSVQRHKDIGGVRGYLDFIAEYV